MKAAYIVLAYFAESVAIVAIVVAAREESVLLEHYQAEVMDTMLEPVTV